MATVSSISIGRTPGALPLALAAIAFGSAAAYRMHADSRFDLLLLAAGSVAVALAATESSKQRAVGAAAVSTAAGVLVLCRALDVGGALPLAIVVTLSIVSVVLWVNDHLGLGHSTLFASAALAPLLPLLVHRTLSTSQNVPIQGLVAAVASLAFGAAVLRFTTEQQLGLRKRGAAHRQIRATAAMLPWAAVGFASVGALVRPDKGWISVTLLLLSAAFMCESVGSPAEKPQIARALINAGTARFGFLTIALASGATVATLVAGAPFGWPIAGVTATGLAALVFLASEAVAQGQHEFVRMFQSANESRIDSLTGLLNRRGFDERFESEVARATRFRHPLTLLIIDIDDFKQINDQFGHQAGDDTLRAVADAIQRSIRSIDVAARFGGDEFTVILPETAEDGAAVVADRIRIEISQAQSADPVSASIGLAAMNSEITSTQLLTGRADDALYRAKRFGKNQVRSGG